jgi:hypothetical protein
MSRQTGKVIADGVKALLVTPEEIQRNFLEVARTMGVLAQIIATMSTIIWVAVAQIKMQNICSV